MRRTSFNFILAKRTIVLSSFRTDKIDALNKKITQIITHVAAWACFLMLPLVFFPRPKDSSLLPEQAFTLFFVLSNALYIAFYYTNTYVLVPKLLERQKIVSYTIIIVALMIFFGSFPRLHQYFFGEFQRYPNAPRASNRPHNFHPPLLSPGSLILFLLLFIFSTGIKSINQWFQSERKNEQIENEKLNTELSFLKAQINPHFLFNTLNNIYALAASKSEQTANAVMKLSNIMRYVLTEARNDLVPLEKEIQFITHYIELQKMRTTDKTCIEFNVLGETVDKQVSPLLFLPFIENAFKYGVSTREKSPIIILMEVGSSELHFKVRNNKYNHSLVKTIHNTGIGINNTRRRLDLLYKNRHTLEILDDAATYTVNLNIHLS